MSAFDIEKYITDLSPEQQVKARGCANIGELMELISDEDIELSDNSLEAVAGCCGDEKQAYVVCNICGKDAEKRVHRKENGLLEEYWCETCKKWLNGINDHHIVYR
ncbi:hypothetical protein [uncultured Ruminococcus sp.]|uniref:hypothetical protein n=1 Tax=uncultured Ruminococcus sp. TaxID=165186 RepID=UPI000EE80960|nr:hypothetical protein [uncultured Ruminococcus sp.]HCJ41112.1 hypothetical protein [Ruminococcus sp.]